MKRAPAAISVLVYRAARDLGEAQLILREVGANMAHPDESRHVGANMLIRRAWNRIGLCITRLAKLEEA